MAKQSAKNSSSLDTLAQKDELLAIMHNLNSSNSGQLKKANQQSNPFMQPMTSFQKLNEQSQATENFKSSPSGHQDSLERDTNVLRAGNSSRLFPDIKDRGSNLLPTKVNVVKSNLGSGTSRHANESSKDASAFHMNKDSSHDIRESGVQPGEQLLQSLAVDNQVYQKRLLHILKKLEQEVDVHKPVSKDHLRTNRLGIRLE